MTDFSLDFPYAHGGPLGEARFRTVAEDFRVDEELGLEPSGSGEHVYLQISKRGENTAWVARQIAGLAAVNTVDIGYCGLKDRHALSSQWFSVYLPGGGEPQWQQLNGPSLSLLACARHCRKLRRGQHQRNRFDICLRRVSAARPALEERLETIAASGCPNYFGEQRFGRQAGNLRRAQQLLGGTLRLRDRQQRGLILSAARAYLFNLVLARRVGDGSWARVLDGDVGGRPSAPLWGRGRTLAAAAVATLERGVLQDWQHWCEALEHSGLRQQRRAAVMQPQNISWRWQRDDLRIGFALAPGQFATSVLREITALTGS